MISNRHSRLLLVAAVVVLGTGTSSGRAESAQTKATFEVASAHASASARRPSVSSASVDPFEPVLRYRTRSPRVRELQVRLRHAKYLALYDVADRFDTRTREAVLKLQRDVGLPATGVVDRATWDALLERSRRPTEAELNNVDVGPWFTAPTQQGFLMELQHRLRQIGVYRGAVDGVFDGITREAIAAWRIRVGLPASDVIDERAWARLIRRTRNPRYADLFESPPASELTQELDPRCGSGKVVCISRQQRRMSYVVDGKVHFTREARFAMPGWESPEGEFHIWYMNSDTVSKIFGERTPMPYAIFYQGNVAIHFSQDFADKGYESGSHGCSQLRDYQVAKWLYEQVKVGDRVVVY